MICILYNPTQREKEVNGRQSASRSTGRAARTDGVPGLNFDDSYPLRPPLRQAIPQVASWTINEKIFEAN